MNYEPTSPPNPTRQPSISSTVVPPARRRSLVVGLGLFLITLALYWPATHFPFTGYDDQLYVYENPHVNQGLSWASLRWASTAVVVANWHPVTILSHLADCSVYGLFAGGHHLTNLLFHAANVLLLWRLGWRLTKSFWTGAFVAALFAWHPLNVESVAWVAERKNVLSTFFFIPHASRLLGLSGRSTLEKIFSDPALVFTRTDVQADAGHGALRAAAAGLLAAATKHFGGEKLVPITL